MQISCAPSVCESYWIALRSWIGRIDAGIGGPSAESATRLSPSLLPVVVGFGLRARTILLDVDDSAPLLTVQAAGFEAAESSPPGLTAAAARIRPRDLIDGSSLFTNRAPRLCRGKAELREGGRRAESYTDCPAERKPATTRLPLRARRADSSETRALRPRRARSARGLGGGAAGER